MKKIKKSGNTFSTSSEILSKNLDKALSGCNNNLWGRTGFDLDSYAKLQAEDDGWPLKKTIKNIYANTNVDMEMAPSVAEADEILAKFGCAEDKALLLAA